MYQSQKKSLLKIVWRQSSSISGWCSAILMHVCTPLAITVKWFLTWLFKIIDTTTFQLESKHKSWQHHDVIIMVFMLVGMISRNHTVSNTKKRKYNKFHRFCVWRQTRKNIYIVVILDAKGDASLIVIINPLDNLTRKTLKTHLIRELVSDESSVINDLWAKSNSICLYLDLYIPRRF